MSFNSAITNNSAMVALQSLSRTNDQLAVTQKRISTGMQVADAKDDSVAFAVSERMRGDIGGLQAANQVLGTGKSALTAARTALEAINSRLNEVEPLFATLRSSNSSADQRAGAVTRYREIREEIANLVNESGFNGVSVLGRSALGAGTGATAAAGSGLNVVRNERGSYLSFAGPGLTTAPTAPGGGTAPVPPVGLPFPPTGSHAFDLADIQTTTSPALLQQYITGRVAASTSSSGAVTPEADSPFRSFADIRSDVSLQLARVGAVEAQFVNQMKFNEARITTITEGIGSLVDANLPKESAQLQSLQIRQQLAGTALSSANSAPQFLLSLFR